MCMTCLLKQVGCKAAETPVELEVTVCQYLRCGGNDTKSLLKIVNLFHTRPKITSAVILVSQFIHSLMVCANCEILVSCKGLVEKASYLRYGHL